MTTDSHFPPERRAGAKARCEAATPGPWFFDDGNSSLVTLAFNPDGPNYAPDDRYGVLHCGRLEDDIPKAQDAEFLAAARIDLPDALAEIERLERVVEELRAK